jgi:osmotically inducible protein OsmC
MQLASRWRFVVARSQASHPSTRVYTNAIIPFGPAPDGFAISRIDLETEGTAPGVNAAMFQAFASDAKIRCPVSKALTAVKIGVEAKLIQMRRLSRRSRRSSRDRAP